MPIIDNNNYRDAIEGFSSAHASAHYAPHLELEPEHLHIRVTLDIPKRSASLNNTLRVQSRRDGAQSIELDGVALGSLSVSSANPLTWQYDGEKIRITFDDGLQKGETADIQLSYDVINPRAGLYFHPRTGGDREGYWVATDHETERARHWLACVDHPNVRTKVRFEITAEAELTALANGAFVEENIQGDLKTTVWSQEDFVCPSYLVCIAVGRFAEFDDGEFRGKPLKYYAADYTDPADLERSFGRTGEMLEWMTARLGVDFPFAKYYQFALPGIGGAMENISLVSWDEIFVLDQDLAHEWTWLLDQINVHEMGHVYFGDAVVCRDFAHVWLKESWATYIETCWLEDKRGEDEWKYDFYRNAHAYFSEADGVYSRPIVTRHFDSSWDMFDRHLYPGGACRLHTLRAQLGDDVFWPAVTDYLDTYMGEVVETDDFRRIMEKHSGESLAQFFDQWFKTAGYPDLKVGFSWNAKAKQATFSIEQKQAKDGHTFEFDFDLAWYIAGKRHTRTVSIHRAEHEFVVDCESDPDMVRVDPDCKVLHKLEFNPGDGKLKHQLQNADVLGQIYAARELAKTGKRENIQAIRDAFDRASFWGVRSEWAKSLADNPTQDALDGLAEFVTKETDPLALQDVMLRCIGLRDKGLANAIASKLDGLSYPWAVGRGQHALGRQRDSDFTSILHEGALNKGIHGIAQMGAVQGLAQTLDSSAIETVQAVLDDRTSALRLRAAAAVALGALAKYAELSTQEAVKDRLTLGLRDDQQSVAKACADGLITMHATSSRAAIEAFAATLPHQDQVSLSRSLKSISDPKKHVLELTKTVDSLTEKLRKLESRLAKLEDKDS